MPSESRLSYSHGVSATPLLGETIGASLRRVAADFSMTVTGKIQKFKMSQMSITELGLQDVGHVRVA